MATPPPAKHSKHTTGSDHLVQQIDLTTLKFKPRTSKRVPEKTYCHVCFQSQKLHPSGIERKLPYPDKGLDMLTCYGCEVTVHHYCYGLKTPINETREHSKEIVKMFVCDKCHESGPTPLRECLLCLKKGGALKKVSPEGYVHVTCALFSDMYCVDNFEKMSIHASSKLDKRVPKQGKPCEYCKKSTHLQSCNSAGCPSNTHIYCALDAAAVKEIEGQENKSVWSFKLGNEENPTKIVVDTEDPTVQKLLEDVCSKLQEVSTKGIAAEQDKPKEEGKNDSAVKGKKKVKKTKGQEHGEDSMITEEDEKLIKEISGNIKEQIKDAFQQIQVGNHTRGGSTTLYCEDHKEEELYCLCQLPYESGREMVACDCCDNWFDYGCLGFTKEQEDQVKGLKAYFCKKCRQWRSFVRDFFEKGIEALENDKEFEIDPQCEMLDKLQCVPSDVSKFTIMEFIIVCLIVQIKLSKQLDVEVIEKGSSIDSILEKLLDSAKFIPFNLNGVAINFIYKSFLGNGIDLLLEKIAPLDQTENIESIYDSEKNEFDAEKAAKLQESVQHLSIIYKVYKNYGLERFSTAAGVKKLLDRQEWMLDVWKTFGQEGSKESASADKINTLLTRAGSLGLDSKLPERVYLESLVANLSDFSNTVRKTINDKTDLLRSKIAELEGVEAQNLPLEKALKALEDIEVICRSALEAKPNLNDLEEIVTKHQGDEKMETEENIKGIKNEITKVKELEKRLKGKKTRSQDDPEKKTTEMCDQVVVLPEMESLIEEFKKGKSLQLKLQFYLRQGVKEATPEPNVAEEEKSKMQEEEDEIASEDKKIKDSGKKVKSSGKKSKDISKALKSNSKATSENKMEIDTQDEDILMEKSDDEGDVGTVEDIEQLLKDSEGLENNRFLKDRKAVKDMLQDITKLKRRIKDNLGGVVDVKDLEAILKETRKFKLAFKEKDEVREKCRLYREKSLEMKNQSASLDELQNLKDEFGKFFKDSRMQNELKNRSDKLKKLEKDIEKFLSKKTFSREDIEKKAQGMIAEIQEQKIKVSLKNDLEDLEKSLAWLEKLYKFRKQLMASDKKGINGHTMEVEQEKEQEGEQEGEAQEKQTTPPEEDKEESKEALSVDVLVKACDLKTEKWDEIYKKKYDEFKEILTQGQKERHRDQRIEKVFKEHVKLYCEIEASSLFKDNNKLLNIEDVDRLCEISERFKIDSPGELYGKAVDAQEKYGKWIKEVEEVVSAEELAYALEEDCKGHEEQLSKLREKAKRLVESYEGIGIESEEENKILRSVWRWLEWAGKGREMLKMVKESQKASLEAIEDFVSCAKELKIPSDSWLYKETNKALDEMDLLKEDFEELKKNRKVIKKKIRGIYKEFNPQKRKKDLEKLGREKPKLDKVKEMEKRLKESSLYVVQGEIDEMQSEMKKCSTWVDKVKAFLEKYATDLNKSKEEGWGQFTIKDDDITKVTGELSAIKSDMRNLIVRDSTTEEELRRFEWFFRASLLVGKKIEKGNNIRAWLKLKTMAEKDKKSEKKLTETVLYTEINNEIEKYNEVAKKIEEIRTKENLLVQNWWMSQGNNAFKRETVSKEQVVNLVKEIEENCKVGLAEELKHLKELITTGDETVEFYKGAITKDYGVKPNLEVIQNLLRRFYSTIIGYPEEEKVLEDNLKKAQEVWELVQKFASGLEKINVLFEKYQECPIFIAEADKLCSEYTKGNELAEMVEMMCNEAENQSLKEIESAFNELNGGLIDFEGKIEESKRKLYRLRIQCLKRLTEKEELADVERIKYEKLKRWRDEAKQVLNTEKDKPEVQEELTWLDQFVQKVEDKVKEVTNIKETSQLTNEMNTACGFIDISKDVNKHRTKLEKAKAERAAAAAVVEIESVHENEEKEAVEMSGEKVMETEVVEEKKASGEGELLGKRDFEKMEADKAEQEIIDEPAEVEIKDDEVEEEGDMEIIQKKVKYAGDKEEKKEVKVNEAKRDENARRDQAKDDIVDALEQNRHFNDIKDKHKKIAKKLELRLFLQFGPRVWQYAKLLEEICWLLRFLNCNQGLSKNIAEKDFDLKFIQEQISKFSSAKAKKGPKDVAPAPKPATTVKPQMATVIDEEDIIEEQPFIPTQILSQTQTHAQKPAEKNEEKEEGTISVSSHGSAVVEEAPKEQKQIPKNTQVIEEEDVEEVEEIEEDEDEEDDEIEDEEEDEEEEEEEDEDDYDEYEDEDDQEVVNLESEEDEATKAQKQQAAGQMITEPPQELEQNLPVYEKGSILMIYDGKVDYKEQLNRSVSLTASSGLRHCYLYTSEDAQFIRKFPKLPKELSIVGKSGQKDALDYIEDLYIGWSSNPLRERPYIVGWIEAKRDVQADIVRLSEELLERKKVALIKYSEHAEMYLLHPSMLKKDMAKQLDWKMQTIAGQRKPKAYLLFMIHKKSRGANKYFEKIEPQFVGMPEKAEEKPEGQEATGVEVLEVEEGSDLGSPLTSLADDELMAGQQFSQMQFNNMNMMNMMAMGGQAGMMEQLMMMGGMNQQMAQMGGMNYNQGFMSMLQAAEAMTTGYGGQRRGGNTGGNRGSWQAHNKSNKRGNAQQNVIVDDEDEVEEYDEDEEDEEDEEEEEEEEDEEEEIEEDEDEDEEEFDEEELEHMNKVKEVIERNKTEEKVKPTMPRVIEEINLDDDDDNPVQVGQQQNVGPANTQIVKSQVIDDDEDEEEEEDDDEEEEIEEIEDDDEIMEVDEAPQAGGTIRKNLSKQMYEVSANPTEQVLQTFYANLQSFPGMQMMAQGSLIHTQFMETEVIEDKSAVEEQGDRDEPVEIEDEEQEIQVQEQAQEIPQQENQEGAAPQNEGQGATNEEHMQVEDQES